MRKFTQGVVLLTGLLAVHSSKDSDLLYAEVSSYQHDQRLEALDRFFTSCACPVKSLATDFLMAADRNNLDWRLLPSISFVESSGGKDYRNNNIFGWDNGRQSFRTVREGLHFVADRLGQSRLYRAKDTTTLLRIYNPRREYAPLVASVMRTIGPAE